jgi:hypothetical protein
LQRILRGTLLKNEGVCYDWKVGRAAERCLSG